MANKLDLTGHKFGKLTVLGEGEPVYYRPTKAYPKGRSIRMWECQCECGRTTLVGTGRLRSGNCRSCGCDGNRSRTEKLQVQCMECAYAGNGGYRKVYCNFFHKKMTNRDLIKLGKCQNQKARPKDAPSVFNNPAEFVGTCINCGKQFSATISHMYGGISMYCDDCIKECTERDQAAIDNIDSRAAVQIAKAIIIQARKDYVFGELQARQGDDRGIHKHDTAKYFFSSGWFRTLAMVPDINEDMLFNMLDKEIERRWNNGQIITDAEDSGDSDWD